MSVQPGKSGAGASRGEVSGTRPISVVIRYSFELNRVFLCGVYIYWEGEGGTGGGNGRERRLRRPSIVSAFQAAFVCSLYNVSCTSKIAFVHG